MIKQLKIEIKTIYSDLLKDQKIIKEEMKRYNSIGHKGNSQLDIALSKLQDSSNLSLDLK